MFKIRKVFSTFFSAGFVAWLESNNPKPYQAKTNGAVMRISPVPFLLRDTDTANAVAIKITDLTHDHPDSRNAVRAYIWTMHMCFAQKSAVDIKNELTLYHGYDMNRTVDTIRPTYNKFYGTCHKSVPEAIICALDATNFEDAIRNAVSLGGDSDTLACMAGAVAEVRFGIPDDIKKKAMGYLPPDILKIMDALYRHKIMSNTLEQVKDTQKTKE